MRAWTIGGERHAKREREEESSDHFFCDAPFSHIALTSFRRDVRRLISLYEIRRQGAIQNKNRAP